MNEEDKLKADALRRECTAIKLALLDAQESLGENHKKAERVETMCFGLGVVIVLIMLYLGVAP